MRPAGNRDESEAFRWAVLPATSTDLVRLDPALKIIHPNWLIYLLCGGPAVVAAARSETTGGENEEEGRSRRRDDETGGEKGRRNSAASTDPELGGK